MKRLNQLMFLMINCTKALYKTNVFFIINAKKPLAKIVFLVMNPKKPLTKVVFFIINAEKPLTKSAEEQPHVATNGIGTSMHVLLGIHVEIHCDDDDDDGKQIPRCANGHFSSLSYPFVSLAHCILSDCTIASSTKICYVTRCFYGKLQNMIRS